jgi:tripartite-type tricarboxylate transporter receptor subunit TctC
VLHALRTSLPPFESERGLTAAIISLKVTLADPAFARYLAGEGAVPAPLSPAAFDAFLRRELATMREVVRNAQITAN